LGQNNAKMLTKSTLCYKLALIYPKNELVIIYKTRRTKSKFQFVEKLK